MPNNKQIVEQINDAFRENSVDKFLALCTDDVAWTMVGEKAVQGKEEIRAWMGKGPAEPPKFAVAELFGEGDFVTCCGDMTMNEKDDEDVPYSYCDVYRFTNGKVAELRSWVIKTQGKAA
jgi:ketosteroid isomerase-like protein